MDITFTEKKENSLLGRTEVKGMLTFEGATPSNAQVSEAIAKHFKTEVANVVLRKVHTKYSKHEATVEGVVYTTLDARKKMERLTPQQKKKLEEEMKKAAEENKSSHSVRDVPEGTKAKEAAKSE
ncbi:MAG TPA: hypothetical protein VJA18_05680 [Candidatus Nanoarchaeia archaeon]|nr:hypothetical protein [Candidatus Nanoarchaeia archaeon]